MIDGVIIVPLRRIPDERGTVYHMLRSTDPHFSGFGEIYFSTIYPGVVKGWHLHRNMTLRYACIFGRVKLALFDERPGSKTSGELIEVFLGHDNYSLVVVPPGVWNGFKGMSEPYAIMANCTDITHDDADSTRIEPFGGDITYDWSVRHE